MLRVLCGPVGVCDSARAECLGLLFGMLELKKLGGERTVVEGDSKVVVSWATDSCRGP